MEPGDFADIEDRNSKDDSELDAFVSTRPWTALRRELESRHTLEDTQQLIARRTRLQAQKEFVRIGDFENAARCRDKETFGNTHLAVAPDHLLDAVASLGCLPDNTPRNTFDNAIWRSVVHGF